MLQRNEWKKIHKKEENKMKKKIQIHSFSPHIDCFACASHSNNNWWWQQTQNELNSRLINLMEWIREKKTGPPQSHITWFKSHISNNQLFCFAHVVFYVKAFYSFVLFFFFAILYGKFIRLSFNFFLFLLDWTSVAKNKCLKHFFSVFFSLNGHFSVGIFWSYCLTCSRFIWH